MFAFLRAPPRALLLAATALSLPAFAHADEAGPLVDAVIVTANPDPEDPPVVADARRRLSETPGAVAVISCHSRAVCAPHCTILTTGPADAQGCSSAAPCPPGVP